MAWSDDIRVVVSIPNPKFSIDNEEPLSLDFKVAIRVSDNLFNAQKLAEKAYEDALNLAKAFMAKVEDQ